MPSSDTETTAMTLPVLMPVRRCHTPKVTARGSLSVRGKYVADPPGGK
jgi:hypothetical protein